MFNYLKMRQGIIYVLVASLLFSSKSIFIKMAYVYHVAPITLMVYRLLFSLPFFIAVSWYQAHKVSSKMREKLNLKTALSLSLYGLLGYYLSSVLDLTGLQYVSAGMERLILYTYPSMVVLLSLVFYKQKAEKKLFLPFACIYGGLFLSFYGDAHIRENGWIGPILIGLAALVYAVYLTGISRIMKTLGSERVTSYSMYVSTLAVLIHFAITHPLQDLQQPLVVYLLALILAIFCTVLPSYMLNAGMLQIGASRTAIVSGVGPIMTLFWGWAVLNEIPGWAQFVGMIIVVGASLSMRQEKAT